MSARSWKILIPILVHSQIYFISDFIAFTFCYNPVSVDWKDSALEPFTSFEFRKTANWITMCKYYFPKSSNTAKALEKHKYFQKTVHKIIWIGILRFIDTPQYPWHDAGGEGGTGDVYVLGNSRSAAKQLIRVILYQVADRSTINVFCWFIIIFFLWY